MSAEKVFETAEMKVLREENEKLVAQLKANREKQKSAKGVSCELIKTAKGPVGFRINGLGIPKFFYKQQALKLLDDTEDGKAMRASVLAWIATHSKELTDKE